MGKRKRSGSFSKTDDSGAKKSDECDSQEELDLDNVSLLTRGFNSSATRCSARVQEKQEKLRREASPSKQILPPEIACPLVTTGTNSTNLPKGNVKHPSPNNEDSASCLTNEIGVNLINSAGLEEKRKKRNWELWSVEDKQLFFEALNEFGKDFDAIQNYLATKLKPRSKSVVCGQYAAKNKDQVRHFYYRTWNKISKHLHFPPEMKKASQELYGLVNYGELRKKQRVLNSKSAVKLCELVENGITSIKFRGKTCRIKTPVCRALKRLNGLEDVEYTRVPHKVSLELTPKNRKAWRSVQSVSHNPRTKVFVGLQRTLASVILFFEEKWKRNNDRLKEQFSSVFGKPRSRLRVIPIDKRELSIPLYKVAENTSSTTICLRSYTKNVLSRERNEDELISKHKRKRKQSGGGTGSSSNIDTNCNVPNFSFKRLEAVDYCLADTENSDVESSHYQASTDPKPQHKGPDLRFPDEQSNEIAWMRFQQKWLDEEEMHENIPNPFCYPVDDNPSMDINNVATETDNDDFDNDFGPDKLYDPDKLCACGSEKPAESENFVSHVWDDERIKLGWTAEEAGVMTIGEMYLMLGQTEKLCFVYCWDTQDDDPEDARCRNLLDRLIITARLLKKKKTTRSKTALLGAAVNNGSLVSCPNCGCKVEIETHFPCVSKDGSPCGVLISNSNMNPNHCQSQLLNRIKGTMLMVEQVQATTVLSSLPDSGNMLTTSPPSGPSKQLIILPEPTFNDFGDTEPSDIVSGETHCTTLDSSESGGISPVPANINQSNCDQYSSTAIGNCIQFPNSELNQGSTGGVLIDLCSLASNNAQQTTKNRGIAANITATILPSSSSIVKNASGSMSVTFAKSSSSTNIPSTSENTHESGGEHEKEPSEVPPVPCIKTDTMNREEISFRRPPVHIAMKPVESADSSNGNSKFPPPKPFVDLPKGNRRLGRRPNFKRVVIPRVLPLLPKSSASLSITPCVTDGIGNSNNLQGSATTLTLMNNASSTTSGESSTTGTTVIHTDTITLNKAEDDSEVLRSKIAGQLLIPAKEKSQNANNLSSKPSDTGMYSEAFLGTTPGSISCNSNDFEDLLKVRRQESNSNIQAGDMDSLSLSSFMEISLPESARMAATECINTDLHIEDLDNSNCSINLSNILSSRPKSMLKDLTTPENSPKKQPPFQPTPERADGSGISNPNTFENPWQLEPGEMSLSSIFGNYETVRGSSGLAEGDVNFQSIINDGSLDFVSKLTELTSPVSDNRK